MDPDRLLWPKAKISAGYYVNSSGEKPFPIYVGKGFFRAVSSD